MSEVKAIAIYPDKRVEEKVYPPGADLLAAFQEIVGGWIESVNLSDGSTMFVNEEGSYRLGPDDLNSIATDVCGLGGRPDILLYTPILGPVVIVGPPGSMGEETSITDRARGWVNRVAKEAM